MALLYFIKLNINKEIHNVYNDNSNQTKNRVLNELYFEMSTTNHVMTKKDTFIDQSDSQEKFRIIEYDMDIFHTDPTEQVLAGDFTKSNPLFARQKDNKGEFITVPVENHDTIRFFFDVKNEIIAFYTAQRFGQKQFKKFFQDYINEVISIKQNERDISNHLIINQHFILRTVTFKYSLEEFYESLLDKGTIQELYFSVIPPNASEEFLSSLDKEAQMQLDDLNDANITGLKEELFSSPGFNMDSDIIKQKFIKFDKLNKTIDSKVQEETRKEIDSQENMVSTVTEHFKPDHSLSVNYVQANAKNISGESFSTTESTYTREIKESDKNEYIFIRICKQFVKELLYRLS